MPRMLKTVCLLLSLSLIAAVESSPQQRLKGASGRGDIVLEKFDSYGLRWQPLIDFENARLRVARRQGLVWEQQYKAGETLDYDLLDREGVPLPDGSYIYEWRVTVSSPEVEETLVVKVQSGHFQIHEGVARSLVTPVPEEVFPMATNVGGNHFVGNLTTDSKLCVGCADGESADVTDADGLTWEAVIRSKGLNPGIVIHEDEIWMLDELVNAFAILDLASGPETGHTVPFRIGDRAPDYSLNVASSGNVSLGTFVPLTSLHVTRSDGTAQLLVEEQSGTTAVRTQFQLWNNGAPRFALRNSDSGVEWSFQQSGVGSFLISREGSGGPEFQVYQSGRVRMGLAGAANFDLDSKGNLTIKGSLTASPDAVTFPDYVFEPDYDLMPLTDLRTFIQQERRLPDIPSAEEVKQQGGHNMTELQLKLLEKIEELTLYTLEQDKKLKDVETLKRENAELKARLAAIEEALSGR